MPKKIEIQEINEIINEIDISRFKQPSVNDLEVSEKDLESFKNFISKEEKNIRKNGIDEFNFNNYYAFPGENTDFNFYKNVAEKFYSISDSVINQVFNIGYGNWSTTTNWRKISIKFKNGDNLTIENSDDKPNYFYAPWIINYKGLILKCNSIALGKKINQLTKGDLFVETAKEKNYAIFKIADFLYKQSLNKQ